MYTEATIINEAADTTTDRVTANATIVNEDAVVSRVTAISDAAGGLIEA